MGIFKVRFVRNGISQVRNIEIPTFEENTIPNSQVPTISGGNIQVHPSNTMAAEMRLLFNNAYSLKMQPIDNATWFNCEPNAKSGAGYTYMLAPYNVTNVWESNTYSVGDKIVFKNGNYIIVTQVSGANMTIDYCLADGTVCYQNVYWRGSNTTYNIGIMALPWHYGNLDDPYLVRYGFYTFYTSNLVRLEFWKEKAPVSNALGKSFFTGIMPLDPENPYDPGGTSDETTEPEGNFSEDSDSVEEDAMPSLSAVGTGMATLFSPTVTQLKYLSDVFWGASWWQALQNTVEGIDKMFVSLGIVPFSVTKGPTVEVNWLGLSITEVMLTLAGQQFYEFDMGSIDMANDSRIFTSGSALDYAPFSKIGIYLPFIGYEELNIDEVRGATINLTYRIDILSGTCVALIKIGGSTIYQFTGNCITQIPITSQNFENLFTNAVNVGIALGTSRAGAAAANAGAEAALEKAASSEVGLAQHEAIGATKAAKVASANSSLASASANTMMGMKPTFNKTGAVSASASLLAVKQPFLFLITPRQCIPEHYQRYCGFPSNITGKLGSFSGYTVVEDIRLNGLVATSAEVGEIYDLLKSGVII